MREEPSSEAFRLHPQLSTGLLPVCVCVYGIPSPSEALGVPPVKAVCIVLLTMPVLSCRRQPQSLRQTTSALVVLTHQGPQSRQELPPSSLPFSGVGDESHLPISAGVAFPLPVRCNKGACAPAAVPLPPPGPGGTWH